MIECRFPVAHRVVCACRVCRGGVYRLSVARFSFLIAAGPGGLLVCVVGIVLSKVRTMKIDEEGPSGASNLVKTSPGSEPPKNSCIFLQQRWNCACKLLMDPTLSSVTPAAGSQRAFLRADHFNVRSHSMSAIYDRVPIPKWRIALYALVASAGVASIGYLSHDSAFYIAAGPGGLLVCVVGIVLSKVRTMKIDERVRQAAPQTWLKPRQEAEPPREL